MTPAFALPTLLSRPALQMATLPVQATGFEALLSVSSGLVAEAPMMPVAFGKPISLPPVVQENESAKVSTPEADIDADIRPLLAVFSGDPAPISITVVSRSSVGDDVSVPEIENDAAQPAQPECAEMVIPAPVVIPTQIAFPAIAAATVAPAVFPTDAAAAKAYQPPKVASSKGGAPVMEPEVKICARTDTAPLPTNRTRQNNAGAVPAADLAGLLSSTAFESNSVFGAGFQTIMSDRIADAAVRPLTDVSALVADRALDLARGSLWLDQLAGDIAAVQDHDRDLAFRLIPAQLGQLDVKIATSEDGLQLNFSTQTDEAARIIGNAQSRLVEELKAQGVRVAGCEVNAGSGQSSFAQQNGQSARAQTITEFDRPSSDFPESTPPNEPQNGRFA